LPTLHGANPTVQSGFTGWIGRDLAVAKIALARAHVLSSGTVGLHRPYIDDPMFAGLPPAEASIRYRQMLDRVVSYLNDMEVPTSIIESMTTTGSGNIRWVDAIDEGVVRPPSIAEWVGASCGRGDA
jgi:hypothetical protein